MQKLLIALLTFYTVNASAQLYDANWFTGYIPVSTMHFIGDSIIEDSLHGGMYVNSTNACISDEQGNLLYITNGISIADRNGNIAPNGGGLNPCPYTYYYAIIGLNINQAALFLPFPGNNSLYYLFHFSNDAADSSRPGTIYYSLVNHYATGNDTVVKKNIPIFQGHVLRGGGMTACKHANGRDYWIVMGASVVNKFYKFLLTPDTILGPFIQTIGPEFPGPFDNAYSKFSQDGSKYATGVYEGPVLVMDFDRCSGEFSNPVTIFNQGCNPPSSCSGSAGVEFSPNGRFLYVCNVDNLNQYDLQYSPGQDSVQIYLADSTDAALNCMPQLGPNGKLYEATWNGGFYFYHVVNAPDKKGDSCHFVWGGQPTLSANSWSLSNLINYKLGPLVGSGCDTITDIKQQTQDTRLLRILPNPADKYVYVEMGLPAGQAGQQGNYEFELLNETGQVLDKKETRQVDIFDTEHLSSGVYFITVTNRQDMSTVITKKLVVQH